MDSFAGLSQGDIGTLALGLLIAGVVGGLVAGMLGVGGGIVVVPILYHVLSALGVEESARMHIAIGTSLATIIPTSLSSLGAHGKKNAVDRDLLKRWWIPMLTGAIGGSLLAGFIGGRALSLIFACVAIPAATHFAFWGDKKRISDHLPGGAGGLALPFGIGGVSAMMGIGGGTVGVPAMTLCGVALRRAVGTASAFGVIVSVPGAIIAVLAGWNADGLPPYSIGYVNLLGFVLIAPAAFLMAPAGAALSHMTDKNRLRIVFAAFIAVTAGRMLWDAFA